ncbi:MAG TPA: hypothetical protein PLL20_10965 [Phycisphaerae bacterium]|nr:hypothetical protein [Phycisphaerae bacterium]HRR86436.1 hypothetical protein [Phycisphaerae bacterium]
MPVLPHQVTRSLPRAVIGLAISAILPTAGCVSLHRADKHTFEPLHFPSADAWPRLVLYGNLSHLLPTFDRTPPLELWLYGPSSFGKTAMRNPQGMALLGTRLLVCDQGRSDIIAVDLADGSSLIWGDPDHRPRCPVDIAVGAPDSVYVADANLRSVLHYGVDQRFRGEIKPAEASDERFRPAALCVGDNILYVGNTSGHQIDRWDLTTRQWLDSLVPPKSQPNLVAPTGLAFTRNGVLLTVDAIGARVFRYRNDGRWLDPIGRPGRGQGELIRPKQVCVTAGGLMLVTDAGRQSVVVFDGDGRFVTEIREQSEAWRGLTLPFGILALSPERMPAPPQAAVRETADPTAYIVVSDSLGRDSLLLLGVFESPVQESQRAR